MSKVLMYVGFILMCLSCTSKVDLDSINEEFSGEILVSERGRFGILPRYSNRDGYVRFEVIVRQGGSSSPRSLVAGGIVSEVDCNSGLMKAVSQKTYRNDGSIAHISSLPGNATRDVIYNDVIARLCAGQELRVEFTSLHQFLSMISSTSLPD